MRKRKKEEEFKVCVGVEEHLGKSALHVFVLCITGRRGLRGRIRKQNHYACKISFWFGLWISESFIYRIGDCYLLRGELRLHMGIR